MSPDRTTKVLLGLIALALWLNLLSPMFHPRPVKADTDDTLDKIEKHLDSIEHDTHAVYSGICLNDVICH
jgi:hypothetical protein